MRVLLSTARGDSKLTEINIPLNGPQTKIKFSSPKPSPLISSLPNTIVEKILHFRYDGSNYLAVSRQSGLIDIYFEDTTDPFITLYENIRLATDFVISLNFIDGFLISCSNRGLVVIYHFSNLHKKDRKEVTTDDIPGFFILINEPIEFCHNFSNNPFKFITGGYNNNIEIYDVTKDYADFENQQIKITKLSTSSSVLRICKSIITTKPSFKGSAQYTRASYGSEKFTWLKDALILSEGDTEDDLSIVTITKFGKLIIYKPLITKVPIHMYQLSNHPLNWIVQLKTNKNDKFAGYGRSILFLDSFNLLGIIDLDSEKVVKRFEVSLIGSIASFDCVSCQGGFLIFIGSIDKFLRMYRLTIGSSGSDEAEYSLKLINITKFNSILPSLALVDFNNSVNELDFGYYTKRKSV